MSIRSTRVIRQKDVADTMRDVLKDKADLPEIEAALTRLYKMHEDAQRHDRYATHEILRVTLLAVTAMQQMGARVARLEQIFAGMEQ